MDQLTLNLERLRRNVDSRVERLLIDRGHVTGTSIPEKAFETVALPLHGGEEPLVISPGATNHSMWPGNEPLLGREPQHEKPVQVPAVIEQGFFRRVLSRFGF